MDRDKKTIRPPFTDEEVLLLNEWQQNGVGHPFTCNKQSKHCVVKLNYWGQEKQEGKLKATTEGWICPCKEYKQHWAHRFMINIQPPIK